jgi:hypothetical protein
MNNEEANMNPSGEYPKETKVVNFVWLEQRVKALETGRDKQWSTISIIQEGIQSVREELAQMKTEKREEIAEIERLTDKFNQNTVVKYNEVLVELCKIQDTNETIKREQEIHLTNLHLLFSNVKSLSEKVDRLILAINEWAWKGIRYSSRKIQMFYECLLDLLEGVK